MKPIGCIIHVCVSSLHAQRMSNIFSLIVPLYYIGCLLFTHNTQNTPPPPNPSKVVWIVSLKNVILENLQILRFSGCTHIFQVVYTYGDFLWTAFLFLDIIFYDLDKSIYLNPGINAINMCIRKYVCKLDDCKEKIKAASIYNDLVFHKLTGKISRSLKLFLSA